MRCLWMVVVAASLPTQPLAGVVATRDLPPGTIIAETDLGWSDATDAGVRDPDHAVGKQARIAIYEGRPVMSGALREPVLVSRNQILPITFRSGALSIETEARALSEGAAGDRIQVMNMASRKTIPAIVMEDGTLVAASSRREVK